MKPVDEATYFTARFKFFGTGGQSIIPSTVHYLIRDIDNDRIVVDWTSVTPASVIEVTVPAEVNEIYHDRSTRKRRTERRVLTVQGNQGQITQVSAEESYVIRNLRGFDS